MADKGRAAEPLCHRVSFQGEVKDGQSFHAAIGVGLSFRMEPTDSAGWQFEIGPTIPTKNEWDKYVYTLTSPWRRHNITFLDTSYGVLAQDAVQKGTYEFRFLANRADAALASATLTDILWPTSTAGEERSIARLGRFAEGDGKLEILSADVDPGAPVLRASGTVGHYGVVHRIAFRVELNVPSSFAPDKLIEQRLVPCLKATAWSDWLNQ